MIRTKRMKTAVVLSLFVCAVAVQDSAAQMRVGINLLPAGWGEWVPEQGGTGSDPFASGRDNINGSDPIWKPEFIEEIDHYHVIRFMDWCTVVNTDRSGLWADRALPTDADSWAPVAFEHMIDLCNIIMADMWVNIVHTADDDYSRQLATLIEGRLDPSLKCYIEWSNETWNYAQSQGSNLGDLNGRAQGTVDASVRVFQAFEDVVGAAAMGTRYIRVVPGWVDPGYTRNILDRWEATNAEADAYATAPYMGHTLVAGPGTIDDLFAELNGEVVTRTREDKAIVDEHGLDFIAYEGGQHLFQGGDVASVNREPRMYDWYKAYADTMSHYFSLFVFYAHAANYGAEAWGTKEYIGQPMEDAPKYHGIFDWMAEHPIEPNPIKRSIVSGAVAKQSTGTTRWYDLSGRPLSTPMPQGTRALPLGTSQGCVIDACNGHYTVVR